MKTFYTLLFIFTINIALLAFKFGYATGQKDADFDRSHANLKLQQCLEVVRGK